MANLQFSNPWNTVALTAATAKTVASLQAATNQAIKILEVSHSHDGNTSTNAPDITDLARCTFAGGGTASASTLQKKDPGRGETIQTTGKNTYTVEPTVITPYRSFNVAQYNGGYHTYTPQAAPLMVAGGAGFLVRVNSPNSVNSTGHIEAEE